MKIALVLDPIEKINPKKDSSLAIAKSAIESGFECYFLFFNSLFTQTDGKKSDCFAKVSRFQNIKLDGIHTTFELSSSKLVCLNKFDAILMRKDPPFNEAYLYSTYILELAQKNYGTLIINHPNSLRRFNEKFFITHYPEFAPKTLISQDEIKIREFLAIEKKAVIKPLNAMGGESIFILNHDDLNLTSILETMLTKYSWVMVQEYLEAIKDGDNRILMIDGLVFDYGVKRLAKSGDFRGNLARGASYKEHILTSGQKKMCQKLAKQMSEHGIVLVGLDLIGDKISEINITSPTCFREYSELFNIDVGAKLIKAIEKRVIDSRK